jgi:hypothetical protein
MNQTYNETYINPEASRHARQSFPHETSRTLDITVGPDFTIEKFITEFRDLLKKHPISGQ